MKNLLTLLVISFIAITTTHGQLVKQDIEVDLLSEIIAEKQNEIKQRVLGDLVVNNIQTSNYAVYNTIYNLVNILTTEKNKTIMKRDIVQEVADYSVAYGLAWYFYNRELEVSLGSFSKQPADRGGMMFGNSVDVERFEEQEKQRNQKKEVEFLLQNYILDEMYKKLATNSFLTDKGFYKKDPFRNYFDSGLDIDYAKVTQDRKAVTAIDGQINQFLNRLSTYTGDIDGVFLFLNSESLTLKDTRKITANDMVLLLGLFENSISEFRTQVGENSFIAVIGDLITKYVMLEVEEGSNYQFEIDVESIILSMEDRFYNSQRSPLVKNPVGVQPFFTIGMNYGFFLNKNNEFVFDDPNNPETLRQLALASEKIGIRLLFNDKKYTRSFGPMEWYQYKGEYYRWTTPQRKPVVNNYHALVYFSGVLYNVVNLKSEENFNYPILGAGVGMEFFNGMQTNISVAMPIVPDNSLNEMGSKSFIAIGFDIPIFEYIQAMRSR